ncbi:MAG: aminodeoxychorismate synthase component I [Gemmataceae bacterium]|nr:aminodeoxychorismate synthase component I [Gemmata sp.]MDW8198868.1 aminodeoxychorismate synthase component I [Gemmataceae bacterium]
MPFRCDAIPVATPATAAAAVELLPAPDPWKVARWLSDLPHLLFLDSAATDHPRGRYSYVAAAPHNICRGPAPAAADELFSSQRAVLASFRLTPIPGLPPFQGGIAGLFGYGLHRSLERIAPCRFDEFAVPDFATAVYPWVVSFDHRQQRAWLVATGFPATGPARADHARQQLQQVLQWLRSSTPPHQPGASPTTQGIVAASDLCPQFPLPHSRGVTSNFRRDDYEATIRRAVDYIHAGDCFQVNLAQRLLAPLRDDPLRLYDRLRQRNPAPFAAYFDLGDFQILSASPERFLRLHPHGEVETRPIKGTRPRGRTPEAETTLLRDLTTNPKDRAENVMIVDLLRNDLGKVCVWGSVRVPVVCEVESFRFVHHLVSEVRGQLRPGLGPLDLLVAAFPGGSVTGAPKVRAMEIIAELEPTARGPYCGCLGWIGFDAAMDTNILIRTFTAGRGWLQFPVGGGIVADSDPAREYDETLHKAAGLLQSLSPAE